MARGSRKLKVKRSYGADLPEFQLSPQTWRGILIVVFLLLMVLSFLSLFAAAGSFGKFFGKILGFFFGSGALISPVIFFGMALALFLAGRRQGRDDEEDAPSSNLRIYLGALLFAFSFTGILHLIAMRPAPETAVDLATHSLGGGYLGVLVALPLFSLLDFWASVAILAGLLIVSLVLVYNLNLAALWRRRRDGAVRGQPARINVGGNDIKINKMPVADFSTAKVSSPSPLLAKLTNETEEVSDETLTVGEKTAKLVSHEILAAKYRKTNWQLPPISLLEDSHNIVDSGNIEANVTIIQKTLADFGIEVEMGEVNVGPTVTQYTLRPAQGVKLSQILALQNDLALTLAAPSIRIEAPIPGRALVGIEVPNKATAIVRIKDVIQTENFVNHKSSLAFALGRDVAGHPVVSDLARMPHLLIAGATGTGKSVAINSLLISLLYRNSPEELRLIVIDPKRVELTSYNGIPHLLTEVVADYNKAVNALKWAVREMDRRYTLLASRNKRNIVEYNAAAEEKLPFIVIVVDELADLMAVAQADVEAAVVRLAQMARAVGVHLVLATQRPSVDIITGLIKANITARMAFAVASQVDSRTILDISGAEKLLGSGDMLYITAELGKPKRIQGSYISEKEVSGVVDFVHQQAGAVLYDQEILERPKGGSVIPGFDGDDDEDDMLSEAIDVVKQAGKASASLLQRRLRVGYARAARLLDLMEEKGVIGPGEGAKPRDVYIATSEDYNDNEEEDVS
jgi:S-DNA-T family DNA segregation ATPase FtsK/SpoIIIE